MFTIEALRRPTEPRFFKLIRIGYMICFLFVLGYFGYLQVRSFTIGLGKPDIIVSHSRVRPNFPGFTICPNEPNSTLYLNDPETDATTFLRKRSPQETTTPNETTPSNPATNDYSFEITCEFRNVYGPGILTGALEGPDPKTEETIPCDLFLRKGLGCYQFRPQPEEPSDDDKNDPSFVYENYVIFKIRSTTGASLAPYFALFFDRYFHKGDDFKFISRLPPDQPKLQQQKAIIYNWNSIDITKTNFFEYRIAILQAYSTSYLGQLGLPPDVNLLKIEVEKVLLPDMNADGEIVFIVKPKQPYQIRYEAEYYTSHPINIIANVGGFYGAVIGFFCFLFGSPRLSPWGIFQKYCFRCWPCRRSFKRHLAARYISSAGIPLGEYVEERPEGSTLERRVQILESLLKEYYIDSYYLDTLRETKIRYQLQKERYNRLEGSMELEHLVNDDNNEQLNEIKIDQ
ncbi:15483_t:CDS:2 [Funneliformis geosporum]|uniref:11307_t:CDS:1 n=1 Tax=Funneliformis geosporum TaxID=1117311 RepID=A0A9W4SS18_9GLOM|nr:11307_t:CDS:2 [Funneliformis geosporum]CAI2181308.1 15483_t:CDS:2 [Funneliformis geosporum]